jgi:enediyne biosynthesis protein E7
MDDERMDVRVSSDCVPGPGGGEAARILARMVVDPLAGYVRLARRYGDVVRVPITPRRGFFLLTRPEHAEHVLAVNQDNYVKAFTYRPLRALVGDGLLTTEGEQWRRHRRLAQPVFSRREVTGFGPHMTAGARRLVRCWDGLADGSLVNVAREMSALTLEIVGHALFGADLTGDADELSRAISVGQQAVALTALLPITWGPASTRMVRAAARRIGRTPEGVEGSAGRLIAARRANGHADRAPADLLDVLLGARDEDGRLLTDTEIGDEVATFMLAGHETTANALSWSLALLSAFPAARQRLEEELDAVLGDRDPDAEDASRLPWTSAVVSEAMRLYPPAWTIERDALADDNVAGTPVPARSLVAISPYLVHRHPAFWPDPAGFDPGRFLPGGGADPATRHRYAFIPFGGGKRACVGASFAELETVLVLATIARRFRLELTASGMPVPVAQVTLRPGRNSPMRLRRR